MKVYKKGKCEWCREYKIVGIKSRMCINCLDYQHYELNSRDCQRVTN